MASPPSPRTNGGATAGGGAPSTAAGVSSSPIDTLFLQNLMSRVQLRPPFLDTNSYLTQNLEDFLLADFAALAAADSDSGDLSDDDDPDANDHLSDSGDKDGRRRRRMLAKEEAKLEKEIVRIIHSGDAEEALKPNSGQSVAIGDHHVCVGFHEDASGDYRVWEWHGHVMLFDDDDDGYSAEYIYGNYFERIGANTSKKKENKKKEEKDGSSGLRDLIGGGSKDSNAGNGGSGGRVVHRNLSAGIAR